MKIVENRSPIATQAFVKVLYLPGPVPWPFLYQMAYSYDSWVLGLYVIRLIVE
jgi:hypothetical protein